MKFLLYILFILLTVSALAQNNVSINLIASKSKLEIGEPLPVKLSIDFPANLNTQQIILPIVTDSAKLGDGIEVWETEQPFDTIMENNSGDFIKHIEQSFTIASFDTGLVDLYPLKAIFGRDTIFSNALTLTINAIVLEPDAKPKPMKAIAEDPFTNLELVKLWLAKYWWIIMIIILIPLIILIIYVLMKNRPEKIEIKEIIPLNIRTLSELEQIENAKLWQEGKYKKYYSRITGVIWEYLSERYDIATFEKTSQEILKQLKFKAVPNDQFVQLKKMMELADMVKFAKTIPTPSDNESAISIAREFIHKTYQIKIIEE